METILFVHYTAINFGHNLDENTARLLCRVACISGDDSVGQLLDVYFVYVGY